MNLYTAQMRYSGKDRLDITVKSATGEARLVAPTWGMIGVDGDKISVVKHAEPFERRSKELEIGILLSVIKRNKIMSGKVKPFKKLKSLVKEKSDESY